MVTAFLVIIFVLFSKNSLNESKTDDTKDFCWATKLRNKKSATKVSYVIGLTVHATVMQEMKSGESGVVRAITSLQTDIRAELQLLPKKIKDAADKKIEDCAEDKKANSDWKLLAMVVDRLCFVVFTVSFVAVIVVFCVLF